jgi:flagellar basal body-associated protein FliL
MADAENAENKDHDAGHEAPPKKGLVGKVVPWLVPLLAVAVCAGAGYAIGRLFGARGSAQTISAAEQPSPDEALTPPVPVERPDTGESWYYDLEPVIGNLNEPGVVRYVRLGLTLEVGSSMTEKEGTGFFEQRKPLLKNWLTLYLNNLSLEDIRGERNLRRIQTQIADAFNQSLFPNAKPRIKRVLFKELSIQ